MLRRLRPVLGMMAGVLLLLLARGTATPLLSYLRRPNSDFSWQQVSQQQLADGVQLTELQLRSQTWQGIPWQHRLVILQPTAETAPPSPRTALLFVTGNYDQGITAQALKPFVQQTGAIAAVLYDVPNQPLFGDLSEDALIAYTFQQYLQTGDATWPLLFPMVKSAATAMTAVQQFTAPSLTGKVEQFVVSGASKRGWTSWLSGLSDPRVSGIIPLVYNNLNIKAQIPHQLTTWGTYSQELRDYLQAGLMQQLQTPEGQVLTAMVDPFTQRERLTLPKLLINGTNDPYWTLDATQFYYDALPGDKHLLYIPNAGHSISDARILQTTIAFFQATAQGRHLPNLTTTVSTTEQEATLAIHSSHPPEALRVWAATSPTRDFRRAQWTAFPLNSAHGSYRYQTPLPASGYLALFAEADYQQEGHRYPLSSEVTILPLTSSP